jgi:hypothetical protein
VESRGSLVGMMSSLGGGHRSNVFNLAALLGIGAIVAGTIALHRKVVVLGGVVALWIAVCCVATATDVLPIIAGLVVESAMLMAYVIVLGIRRDVLARIPFPRSYRASRTYGIPIVRIRDGYDFARILFSDWSALVNESHVSHEGRLIRRDSAQIHVGQG